MPAQMVKKAARPRREAGASAHSWLERRRFMKAVTIAQTISSGSGSFAATPPSAMAAAVYGLARPPAVPVYVDDNGRSCRHSRWSLEFHRDGSAQ